MNGKAIIAFILGAATGSIGTYLYLDRKYREQNAENLEMNRRWAEDRVKESDEQHEEPIDISEEESQEEENIPEAKRKANDLASKLNYNSLYNKEPLVTSEQKPEDQLYLITPEQYDSETLYERRVLTYYEGDDTLCDELTEEVLDIENFIGIENIESFGNNFEDDPYIMHIRNNKFGCVYEVIKDERSYSAVVGDEEE